MTEGIVDFFEPVDIDHHNPGSDVLPEPRLLHIAVDLPAVIQAGQGINGDHGLHILDIEEHHHDSAAEAEQGSVEFEGLDQAEKQDSQGIDSDQQEQALFFFGFGFADIDYGENESGEQIKDRGRNEKGIIQGIQFAAFADPESGCGDIGDHDTYNRYMHGKKAQVELFFGLAEVHPFGSAHVHEPLIGHQAQENIIQEVEKND